MNNNKQNNDEQTNGHSTDAENLFKPTISINIPITATKAKTEAILSFLGIDAPMPPLEQITYINLQITIENGGQPK